MVHIKIEKGLNIPIEGAPVGMTLSSLPFHESNQKLALHLGYFDTKFHLLAKVGDRVKKGEAIAWDKSFPLRKFVAPAGGVISEIRRGLKRALTYVIIDKDAEEAVHRLAPFDLSSSSVADLIKRMGEGGILAKVRKRPFDTLADPEKLPDAIFIKALESAPFVPPAEMQVKGHERHFQKGLDALNRIAPEKVHLIYRMGTTCKAFNKAENVIPHTAEGPHPIANSSLHIQKISPIFSHEDTIWALNAHDVVCLGYLLNEGEVFFNRIVSVAGPGVLPGRSGYFLLREGYPLAPLLQNRINNESIRFISGDPLMGHQVQPGDFLGFSDCVLTCIPENTEREFLHFFRGGSDKYSFSRAYLSGHFNLENRTYPFTTSLHGEHRPFIDSTQMDKVQPLDISAMHLVKALLAEDYESAAELGLLEVAPEDFALPTFVDPSKVEMVEIVRKGIRRYLEDLGL